MFSRPYIPQSVRKIQMHIRIDKYLKEFLWKYAEENDTTASDIIRKFVRELFEKHEIRKESEDVDQL